MRVIEIAERTREEKEEPRENRLVVATANMRLLDSDMHLLLLRSRSHTVLETIIQLPKEKNVRPTKEEISITLLFVMLFSLPSSPFYHRSVCAVIPFYHKNNDRSCGYIYMHACLYIYICLKGLWLVRGLEREFDRTRRSLMLIFLFSNYLSIHLSIHFSLSILK